MAKKWLICMLLAAIMLSAAAGALAAGNGGTAYTLETALTMVDDADCPDRILLSDSFEHLDYYGSDYLEVGYYDKLLVLFREAPLKEFEELEIEPDEEYVGVDLGEYEVYLCADLMARIPEEYRATGFEDAGVVIMAETMYDISATMISSTDIDDLSAEERDLLESTMKQQAGEEDVELEDAPEESFQDLLASLNIDHSTYHPLFCAVTQITIYDWNTGASTSWYRETHDFGELRNNPEADDVWETMLEWLNVYNIASGDQEKVLEDVIVYWISDSGYIQEDEIMELLEMEAKDIAEHAVNKFWALVEKLGEYDPARSDIYAEILAEYDLERLFETVPKAMYAKIDQDTYVMEKTLAYTGQPDLETLNETLGYTMELLELCEWDVELLDYALTEVSEE